MTKKLVLSIFIFIALISNISAETPEILINPSSEEYTRLSAGLAGSNISIIDANEIRKNPNKNLSQILETYSGITTRTTLAGVDGAYTEIDMRGFGEAAESNVLILINGKRLNDIDMSGVNFSYIPIESIERIEVIRGGSAATLYGSGAVAGAINLVTNNQKISNKLKTSVGSYNYRNLNFSTGLSIGNDTAIALSGSKTLNENFRDAADFDEENLLLNFRQKLDNIDFNLDLISSANTKDLPGPRVKGGAVYNYHFCNRYEDSKTAKHIGGSFASNGDSCNTNQRDDYANTDLEKIDATASFNLDELNKVYINLGYKTKTDKAFFAANTNTNSTPSNADRYLKTIIDGNSFDMRYENKQISESHSNILNIGFEIGHSFYNAKRFRNESESLGQEYHADMKSRAFYIQNTYYINNSDFALSFGARQERTESGARDEVYRSVTGFVNSYDATDHETYDNSRNNYAYNIGFEKGIDKHLSIYGSYSESFRIPNIDEHIAATTKGSFALKDQESEGSEIGVLYRNNPLRINASYYQLDTLNEIQLAYFPGNDGRNTNLDPIERQGVNVDFTFNVNKISNFRGSFNYTKAEFTSGSLTPGAGGSSSCDYTNNTYCSNSSTWQNLMGGGTSYSLVGKSVPLVAPITYSIGYETEIRENLIFDLELKYTDEKYVSNDQENIEPKMPDYYIVNTHLNSTYDNYNLTFGINNLFDEAAYDFAVASAFHDDAHYGLANVYPLPERNFFFDLGYTF